MSDEWKKRAVISKEKARAIGASGWHSRGYLPHFDRAESVQAMTFHLFDSLPREVLLRWKAELAHLTEEVYDRERRKRIDAYLDQGHGSGCLKDNCLAAIVQNALLYFDGQRYTLRAWVVMPNHVHVLFTPQAGWDMSQIAHSWKSFTANECNRVLKRQGEFWQQESFDRYIRDEKHYRNVVHYIENNPVMAGLCNKPEDWLWSSARLRE